MKNNMCFASIMFLLNDSFLFCSCYSGKRYLWEDKTEQGQSWCGETSWKGISRIHVGDDMFPGLRSWHAQEDKWSESSVILKNLMEWKWWVMEEEVVPWLPWEFFQDQMHEYWSITKTANPGTVTEFWRGLRKGVMSAADLWYGGSEVRRDAGTGFINLEEGCLTRVDRMKWKAGSGLNSDHVETG